jgi:hypothetical protein
MFCNQDLAHGIYISFLSLRITKENSLLKVLFHFSTEGTKLLKIHKFLLVQMLQHMTITTRKYGIVL